MRATHRARSSSLASRATDCADDVFLLLRSDPNLVRDVEQSLLDQRSPDSLHDEILGEVGLDLGRNGECAAIGRRDARDPEFRRAARQAYLRSCAVCGLDEHLSTGPFGLDAAHAKWKQAGEPDGVVKGSRCACFFIAGSIGGCQHGWTSRYRPRPLALARKILPASRRSCILQDLNDIKSAVKQAWSSAANNGRWRTGFAAADAKRQAAENTHFPSLISDLNTRWKWNNEMPAAFASCFQMQAPVEVADDVVDGSVDAPDVLHADLVRNPGAFARSDEPASIDLVIISADAPARRRADPKENHP